MLLEAPNVAHKKLPGKSEKPEGEWKTTSRVEMQRDWQERRKRTGRYACVRGGQSENVFLAALSHLRPVALVSKESTL